MLVSDELRRQNVICEHIYRVRRQEPYRDCRYSGWIPDQARNGEKLLSTKIAKNSQYSDIIYKHYINLPQRKPVGQIQRELGIRICQSVAFWY